uniref:Uncharacterized protein n=1 Tax=Anguilla anguilla TaxID=7936 RepID=A0A0E9WWE7_ANGAN
MATTMTSQSQWLHTGMSKWELFSQSEISLESASHKKTWHIHNTGLSAQ